MMHLVKGESSSAEPDPATPGLRERKKRARRELLVRTAHHLVGLHGLDAVTVEAICAEAGVSTRTFFNYFESKVDAVLGLEPWSLDPQVAATFAAGGPSGRWADDIAVLVTALLDSPPVCHGRLPTAIDLVRADPRLLVRQVTWMEQQRGQLQDLVAARQEATGASPYGDLVGMVVLILTRTALTRWEAAGAAGNPRDLVPAALDDLRALLTEP